MNARRLLPLNVVVTDIQPAPANLAGARSRDGNVSPTQRPQADRLIGQGGHWLITMTPQ
jgi:hypothetical protein